MEPRTIELNARTQYGENLIVDIYQIMQHSHEQYRQLVNEHSDTAIDKKTKDHNKKHTQENSKKVNGYCLRWGIFKEKNWNLSEIYKEQHKILKINSSNPVLLNNPSGIQE